MEFFLERKLELSQEQMDMYRQLRKGHFEEVGIHVRKMRRFKTELFDLVGKDNNEGEKKRLLEEIGKTQLTIDSLTFIHFENLREICNEDQQLRFDHLIKEVMHRLERKGPSPGGRRRGR